MSLECSMRARNRRSLPRSASSAALRLVMSRAMPTSPITIPVESRHGVLVERKTRLPSGLGMVSSTTSSIPLSMIRRSFASMARPGRRVVVEFPVAVADDLLGRPADGADGGRVCEEDLRLPVLHEHRVGRGLDDLPEELASAGEVLLGPAPLRDVEQDAGGPTDPVAGRLREGGRADQQHAPLPVGAAEVEFLLGNGGPGAGGRGRRPVLAEPPGSSGRAGRG